MGVHHARTEQKAAPTLTVDAIALSFGILLLDEALRLIRP